MTGSGKPQNMSMGKSNIKTNDKGFFNSLQDLQTKYPTGKDGRFASVGDPVTEYRWSTNSNQWIPESGGGGGMESVSGNIVDNTDPLNPIVDQLQPDWNEADNSDPSYIQNKPTIPVIPTEVSDFNNDAGYITQDDIPAQIQADWNETNSGLPSFIQNKPFLRVDITYGDFETLINASGLTKGVYYRITDFQTTYQIPNTSDIYYGTIEPLIVFANDVDSIDNKVFSKDFPNDTIVYDHTDNVCEDNTTPRPGSIVYRKDQVNNISFFYDRRNVVYRRWETSAGSGIYTELTYNGEAHVDLPVIDMDTIGVKDIEVGFTNKPYSNYGKYDNNVFVGLCSNNVIGSNSYDNTINTGFTFNNVGTEFNTNIIDSDCKYNNIYNSFSNNIIFPQFIKNTCKDNFSMNSIGLSMSSNIFGYSCNNNVLGAFREFNTIGGDFAYNNCGNSFERNTIGDSFTFNVITDDFKYNTIKHIFDSNIIGVSFQTNNIGNNFGGNQIDDYFVFNTIGDSFNNNIVGAAFRENNIAYYFASNTLGDYFYSNVIGNNFISNTIDSEFVNNNIGKYFSYNNVGAVFGKRLPDDYYAGNTIGDYCMYNYLAPGIYNNNLGNFFQMNKIGTEIVIEYANLTGGTFSLNDSVSNGNGVSTYIRYDNGSNYMTVGAIKPDISNLQTFQIGDIIDNLNGVTAEITNILVTFVGIEMYDNVIHQNMMGNEIDDSLVFSKNTILNIYDGKLYNSIINTTFISNVFSLGGIDFSSATILPSSYSKEVLINADDVIIVRYVDATNNIVIDDVNA